LTSAEGLPDSVEGILGLSQNKQMIMSETLINVGPLFTNALYNEGRIDTPSFSFAMQGFSSDVSSNIDFGTPVASRVLDGEITLDNSVTLSFLNDFYWSTTLQAISFGPELSFAVIGTTYSVFDSGNSNILVPTRMLKSILDFLVSATNNVAKYKTTQGITYVDCAYKHLFKPIKVMFSGTYLTINPEDYIHDSGNDKMEC
jgi:hypothetical protein